jgi:hypothetical protein
MRMRDRVGYLGVVDPRFLLPAQPADPHLARALFCRSWG